MKRIFIIVTMLNILLLANVDNKSIDDKERLIVKYQEMFEKISQKRVGLDENEISKVFPPFVKPVKKKEIKGQIKKVENSESLTLEAILGNRVMINGNWYKLYQYITDMKIISIVDDKVYLQGNGKTQKLTIRTKNANITIK